MAAIIPKRERIPLDMILDLWHAGLSLADIGERFGVSRQAISFRLVRAGYSPAERRAQRRADHAVEIDAYREQRMESVARRAEARAEARVALIRIAAEHGVRPYTLAQFVARRGPYANATETGSHASRLPPRPSPAGEALAAEVTAALAPFSAMSIGRLVTSMESA